MARNRNWNCWSRIVRISAVPCLVCYVSPSSSFSPFNRATRLPLTEPRDSSIANDRRHGANIRIENCVMHQSGDLDRSGESFGKVSNETRVQVCSRIFVSCAVNCCLRCFSFIEMSGTVGHFLLESKNVKAQGRCWLSDLPSETDTDSIKRFRISVINYLFLVASERGQEMC